MSFRTRCFLEIRCCIKRCASDSRCLINNKKYNSECAISQWLISVTLNQHWHFVSFSDVSFRLTISLVSCSYNLDLTDSKDMSIRWEKREMIEVEIRDHTLMQKVQIRVFQLWQRSARKSGRLIWWNDRYFLQEFVFLDWLNAFFFDRSFFLIWRFFWSDEYVSLFLTYYLFFFLIDKHAFSEPCYLYKTQFL